VHDEAAAAGDDVYGEGSGPEEEAAGRRDDRHHDLAKTGLPWEGLISR